jgi:hypothetical protein
MAVAQLSLVLLVVKRLYSRGILRKGLCEQELATLPQCGS